MSKVLNTLKDTDIPKLAWAGKSTRAAVYETWLQQAALRIGGLHPTLKRFWNTAVEMADATYQTYLATNPLTRT